MARKAVERNCAWLWPTPKAPITCGMATLVSELVKIEVKNADKAAAVASHLAAGVNAGTVNAGFAVVNGRLVLRDWRY